jgi:LysR family nitrogen assimilation transcriptional regulator
VLTVKLRQLEYVLWVARLGSFSRAASKLRVAQPSISKQIHALEEELGIQLFHRDGHGAVPTSAARILCNTAETIFKQLEDTKVTIANMQDSPTGTVNLGVPPSLSQYFATDLGDIVKARYANICLKITEGWTGLLYDWIVSDQIDLGIIYSSQITEHLVWEPLVTEDVCVVALADTQPDVTEYSLSRVARLRLVVPPRPHGLRLVIDKVFAHHGLTPNIILEAEVWNVLKEAVGRGDAYGLLPPSEVREEIESGRFRAITISEPGIKRTLCIARARHKRMTKAVDKVLKLVINETNKHVRDEIRQPLTTL